MNGRLFSLGTRVAIHPDSEHYGGQMAWVVEVCDDPEYPYCVSSYKGTGFPELSFWVRREHVTLPKGARRPDWSRVESSPKVKKRLDPRSAVAPDSPIQVGDVVMVDPSVPFGTRMGYVVSIDPGEHGSVAISRNPATSSEDVQLWVQGSGVQAGGDEVSNRAKLLASTLLIAFNALIVHLFLSHPDLFRYYLG